MSTGPQRFGVETLLGGESSTLASTDPLELPIVVHGDVQRFAAFAQLPALRSASAVLAAWDGIPRTARAWSPSSGPAYELYPTREQLRPLYDAGCTIVLENVEGYVVELRPLCRALERDLGVGVGTVNVEVFCARGAGLGRAHFDPSFTFNCQIDGSKTWRLERNDAVQFPPTGMFLGRAPEPELARLLHKPLPDIIEGGETVTAEPGTVVFLPPGVLHETRTATGSYAIAFAIERTESIARQVSEDVRVGLQRNPALRAARLGAQLQNIRHEAREAAKILRRIADELEFGTLARDEATFRLRPGLSAEPLDATHVMLRGANVARTFALDEMPVTLLGWASQRAAFSLSEVARNIPLIDPDLAENYLGQLLHLGLVEYVP